MYCPVWFHIRLCKTSDYKGNLRMRSYRSMSHYYVYTDEAKPRHCKSNIEVHCSKLAVVITHSKSVVPCSDFSLEIV